MAKGAAAPPASLHKRTPKAITIAILAMGGEGGGVLADWIVDLAEHSGYRAQTTSVPGVAQRTGSTIYYLEIFPEEEVQAACKEPILALMPVPGEVDIVLASELMEAGRAIQRGLVTPDRTTLIASTNRVYSMTEKTAITDSRVDSAKVIEASSAAAKTFVHGDFARIAEDARSVISASLFGALAATGALPFRREQFEDAIRKGGVGVESSLAAFDAGFRAAAEPKVAEARLVARPAVGPRLQTLAARITKDSPQSRLVLYAGIERLADYQDVAYATEYLDRLEPIRDLDSKYGKGDFALLSETARYLALWMSYEDAPRVADLKIRRTRFDRVHQDARVDPAQMLQIKEFLHPRVQEIADMVPAPLGRLLLRSNSDAPANRSDNGQRKNRRDHLARRILATLYGRRHAPVATNVAALQERRESHRRLARADRARRPRRLRARSGNCRMPAHGKGLWRHPRARRKKLRSHHGRVAEVAWQSRCRAEAETASRSRAGRRHGRKVSQRPRR